MLWELSDQKLTVAFTFLCTASFICGWIADRIMDYAGFGVIGNWLLLFFGAAVGLYSYNLYGVTLTHNMVMTLAVTVAGGSGMLLALAGVKAVTHT